MAFKIQGSILTYILVASFLAPMRIYLLAGFFLTACSGSGSNLGLPSITVSGDGIGYAPTGNGLIPTNQNIGTSASGNSATYRGHMSGEDPDQAVNGNQNGEAPSIGRAEFPFEDVYRTELYQKLLEDLPENPSILYEISRQFFTDDITSSVVSAGMRSLSQAVVDGGRCVANEAIKSGKLKNIYERNATPSFQVISMAGLLGDEFRLVGGSLPDKITIEAKNTQSGVEVKVASCANGVPVRGERVLLEPSLILGQTEYTSTILEVVESTAGHLVQQSSVSATVVGANFLEDEKNPIKVNFKSLPDVEREISSPTPSVGEGAEKRYPYAVVSATYDAAKTKLNGASAYGTMDLSGLTAPRLQNISDLSFDFVTPVSNSSSGGLGGVPIYNLLLSNIQVGTRIYVNEKTYLTLADCSSALRDYSELLDYFFSRQMEVDSTRKISWADPETIGRDFRSACIDLVAMSEFKQIVEQAQQMKNELASFRCEDSRSSPVIPAATAKVWVDSCMLAPPSEVYACAEPKAAVYRNRAKEALLMHPNHSRGAANASVPF